MNFFRTTLFVAAFGLAACSSEPAKTTEVKTDDAPKKTAPAEAVSGKTAYWEMYTPAHAWAADIMPISLKSGEVAGIKNADGKAGVWIAIFGSPSLKQARTYQWAAADQLPTYQKGVKAEGTEPWAGPTTAVMTFNMSDVTTDSDAAYKVAAEKAGTWLKEKDNAEKPVAMSLGAASRFPAPVWYFMFGNDKSGFASFINSSTGTVVTK